MTKSKKQLKKEKETVGSELDVKYGKVKNLHITARGGNGGGKTNILKKEKECYYPDCKAKGVCMYGKTGGWFMFCRKHQNLVLFMRDMYDYFKENL